MFDNIGGKIKTLAQVICWIGIACSVVFGIAVVANEYTRLLGIAIIVLGPLLSWVSSFLLYGFGQLIENTDMLVGNKNRPVSNNQNFASNKPAQQPRKNNMRHSASVGSALPKDAPISQSPAQDTFLKEIKAISTADLELIVMDQADMYSEQEFAIIKRELESRKNRK